MCIAGPDRGPVPRRVLPYRWRVFGGFRIVAAGLGVEAALVVGASAINIWSATQVVAVVIGLAVADLLAGWWLVARRP
jgi:hypothetical protein